MGTRRGARGEEIGNGKLFMPVVISGVANT